MKFLSLVILIAFSTPACSRFTKTGRMDRAYYKQLKQASVAREKHRKNLIRQQSAKIPAPDAPPPVMEPKFQAAPDPQS
jgi:hypothetical protein